MTINASEDLYAAVPDGQGRFGEYGGKFVSETLMAALTELEAVYCTLATDKHFQTGI